MIDRFAKALRLDRDEARRAVRLGLVLFGISASYTLMKTARDAAYLAHLPATTLPYVFFGVGLITTVLAAVFTKVTHRVAAWKSLEASLWVTAASLGLFAWLFRFEERWVSVLFYLWVNVYGLILISQFWVFTNSQSHPSEAKRIFGIIGVGGILGGLFAGLAAAPLAHAFGLAALLIAAAALVVVVMPVIRGGKGAAIEAEPEVVDDGPVNPLDHPYVRWLALATLCSVLVATLIDYQFKIELQRHYASPASIASFLGLFYVITNLAALTMQVFATRWSLERLGAGWSAAILPSGLLAGGLATLFVPGFISVTTTRVWDQVMRISINRSATELFFFPLAPGLRRRAQALIDAGLERIGDALAGLLILLVGAAMGAAVPTLAAIVTALVLVWIGAWLRVRRDYVIELGRNLRRMNLDLRQARVSLREAGMLEGLERTLDSSYERVVLHGIDMLEEMEPGRIVEHLPRLFEHPAAAVRIRSLQLVKTLPASTARIWIRAAMHDEDAEVRVAALRAHAASGENHSVSSIEEFLTSENSRVREAALTYLAEFASPGEEALVRRRLERTLEAGSVEERVAVLQGLGARPGPSALHVMIAPRLEDPALVVRRAALVAAGRAGIRVLVPRLIDALAERETRAAARNGLAVYGDRVVGTLADYLCDPSVALPLRREIPRVLGDIGTAVAAQGVMRCVERDDVRLAYRVLKAANRIRLMNDTIPFPRETIGADLEFDARSHLFAFVHYRSCPIGGAGTAERLLCIALNERMDQALNRLFRRLALIHPPRDLYAAYQGVISMDPRMRGNALEYLETALSSEHRALVLPLVDDSGDEGRIRFAEQRFGLRFIDPDASLKELLEGTDSWLRACALYVVGARRERSFLPLVERHIGSLDPHVGETAAWARLALTAA